MRTDYLCLIRHIDVNDVTASVTIDGRSRRSTDRSTDRCPTLSVFGNGGRRMISNMLVSASTGSRPIRERTSGSRSCAKEPSAWGAIAGKGSELWFDLRKAKEAA